MIGAQRNSKVDTFLLLESSLLNSQLSYAAFWLWSYLFIDNNMLASLLRNDNGFEKGLEVYLASKGESIDELQLQSSCQAT